jgi:transcription antitermination factor NusA-like protein
MVNTPICDFCAQTGMLCKSCQDKLDKGVIVNSDIEIAKELIKLENQFPTLKEVNLSHIIHNPDFDVLVVDKGNIANLIGPKGRILKELEKIAEKKLRVIEKNSDYIKVIDDLLSPMRVLGVNKVFLPTGETVQKVRIKKIKGIKISINTEKLEKLVYDITKQMVRLSFE